jgi:hypothetical protein
VNSTWTALYAAFRRRNLPLQVYDRFHPQPSEADGSDLVRGCRVPLPTIVAIADLRGHCDLFCTLLAHLDHELGDAYSLVTLGDYVDNGPQVPALLDRLIQLRADRPARFFPIIGNHDLACLRSIGWDGGAPDEEWYERWSHGYWDRGGSTPAQYGASSAEELRQKMPDAHRQFLQSLPWFHQADDHIFVHAGLRPGPVGPQLEDLRGHPLLANGWTVQQLRDKQLATASDPAWESVVVSGHTKQPARAVMGHPHAPHFATPHRITLSAEVDQSGVLYAVALPERRFYGVDSISKTVSQAR